MLTVTMNPPPAEKLQDVTTTTTTPNTNTIQELLEWNLIDSISPYLDRHMIFPLLDYFEKQILEINSSNGTDNIHHRQQVLQNVNEARYSLLRPTHMIDYMMDVHKSLNETETMPEVMTQQKQQVLEVLENLKKQCLPLLEEIDTTERVRFLPIQCFASKW
jgi:eIF3 subunit 6 N terminal domain